MINFVNVSENYKNAVDNIHSSVKDVLGYYTENSVSLDGCINVHSFVEEVYLNRVNFNKGINVFLSHGVADKNHRTSESLACYDYCIVEGDWILKKLINEGYAESKIIIGGYPKFYKLNKLKKEKISDSNNILFAPTHTAYHSSKCSLYNFNYTRYLSKISGNVVVSEHPADNDDYIGTLNKLVDAKCVISDWSSMIYEAWSLDLPVIFFDWLLKDHIVKGYPNSAEAYIYENSIGRHAQNIDEVDSLVQDALLNGITQEEINFREQISNTYLRENSPAIIAKALMELNDIHGFM